MSYRIAFIGMGSIAQDVKGELRPLFEQINAEILVLRRQQSSATIEDLLAFKPQLVIEIASQEAVKAYVPDCLRSGATVIISSVGALADADFHFECGRYLSLSRRRHGGHASSGNCRPCTKPK